MKAVLGVDGGVSGAIAYLNERGVLEVVDVPKVERLVGGKAKNVLDPKAYLAALKGWATKTILAGDLHAFFERGGEIPFVGGDGRRRHQAGMYGYGWTNGALFMGAVALDIPAQVVEPQTWKRYFHLLGKDKEASRACASELYPAYAFNWKNKGHHNRAEAVLIARYGLDFPK